MSLAIDHVYTVGLYDFQLSTITMYEHGDDWESSTVCIELFCQWYPLIHALGLIPTTTMT